MVGVATVDRIIRRYRNTGSVSPARHGGGAPRAIPKQLHHVLVQLVHDMPDATLTELARALKMVTGIKVSRATVGRTLHELRLTFKQKSMSATERQLARVVAARKEFLRQIVKISPERLLFIDETGTHIAMTRTHAWAERGKRAPDTAPRNRGRVLTLIGALSIDGFETVFPVEGKANGAVFRYFVTRKLAPQLRKGDVVVMDRLGAHLSKGIRDLIEACGATVKYLPSYSPDLNPCEEAWSKLKTLLKRVKARTKSALRHVTVQPMV